ncbi:MAG: hypothetical protein IJZ93_02505 [Clostridia bacterium]|nr:hypothetical protein [Clostridia bacterium]
MKVDRKSINMLLKLNDDNLWKALQFAASKSGAESMKDIQKPNDMTKIRATLSALSDEDLDKINELLKGGKGGIKK